MVYIKQISALRATMVLGMPYEQENIAKQHKKKATDNSIKYKHGLQLVLLLPTISSVYKVIRPKKSVLFVKMILIFVIVTSSVIGNI